MKADFKDMTFLIPVRIDSVERIENILANVSYLRKRLNTNIIVLEASNGCNKILKHLLPKEIGYHFVYDDDVIFFRTHYLNIMASMVKTKFLAIWDADVIVPVEQMQDSIQHLRNNTADVAHPYDGTSLETSDILRKLFLQTGNVDYLLKNRNKMQVLYSSRNMKGGGLFISTNKYIQSGKENENFYGWGPEDFERCERWEKFGYRFYRSKGEMLHLTHPRDLNGRYNSYFQMRNQNLELFNIRNFSKEQIIRHLDINWE